MTAHLKQLKSRLETVCKDQQFHMMLDLDVEIRQCVIDMVDEAKNAPDKSREVSNELKDLMMLYHTVVARCDEKSQQLKNEYMKINSKKQVAVKYLDIASQFS